MCDEISGVRDLDRAAAEAARWWREWTAERDEARGQRDSLREQLNISCLQCDEARAALDEATDLLRECYVVLTLERSPKRVSREQRDRWSKLDREAWDAAATELAGRILAFLGQDR